MGFIPPSKSCVGGGGGWKKEGVQAVYLYIADGPKVPEIHLA